MDQPYQDDPELKALYDELTAACNAYMRDAGRQPETIIHMLGALSGVRVDIILQFCKSDEAFTVAHRIHVGMLEKLARLLECPPGTKLS